MDVERTPDARFEDLPDWPFEPRYTQTSDGLRLHFVDEGPPEGPLVVLAHGEPTWSYLYRKMIPGLVTAGCRTVAPDLVGFGRSDKPTSRDAYLPPGIDLPVPDGSLYHRWLAYSQEIEPFSAAEIVGGDSPINQIGYRLSEDERRAYDAPFPDESFCAGARQFPLLIPMTADHPDAALCREIWSGPLPSFDRPTVTAFGSRDTATLPSAKGLESAITGAAGQPHRIVEGAGHFIQEHAPNACVEVILDHLDRAKAS